MKNFLKKFASVMAVVTVGAISGCDCGNSKYTITFDYGQGGGDSTIILEGSKTITKPENPSKNGYIFGGWYEDSEYTREFDFSKSVNKNLTIYAKWIKVGYITTPSGDLISDGYMVTMPESQDDELLIGEEATFYLTLSKDYLKESNPVFKINGVAQTAVSEEVVGENKKYTYTYVSDGENVDVVVEGVHIDTYTITLPEVEGITIHSVSGYNNNRVSKYQDYKFRIVADTGYDISYILVNVDGIELQAENGVYTIRNVTANINSVEISGVVKQRYTISYYENGTAITNYNGDRVKITNANSSIIYGNEFRFNFEVVSKYSDVADNIDDYITITVGGVEVDKQVVNNNTIVVNAEDVTGDIRVNIRSSEFPVNKLAITLPQTSLDVDGYELYVAQYKESGSNEVKDVVAGSELVFDYNSYIYVGIRIKDEYLAMAKQAGLYILKTNGSSDSTNKAYNFETGMVEFNIKNNTTLSIDSKFDITKKSSNGIQYISSTGYLDDKADVFGSTSGIYKFKLAFDTDAYDYSAMTIECRSKNSAIANPTIEKVGDEYVVTGIKDDIIISVNGVVTKQFDITLPNTIVGLDNIKFADSNDTNKVGVTHFDEITLAVYVSESHNYNISNLEISVGDLAKVTKISTENNVVTFKIREIKGDITSEDIQISGLVINRYSITLPNSNGENYSLYSHTNDKLTDTLISYSYGQDLVIKIKPKEMYTKDNEYSIILNQGQDDENIINVTAGDVDSEGYYSLQLSNITTDITVTVQGIDTKNVYSVSYYDYNDTLINTVTGIVHGDVLSLIEYNGTMPDNYEFGGWYYDNDGTIGDKATNGDRVMADLKIVANKKATIYSINFVNMNEDGMYRDVVNSMFAQFGIEDYKLNYTIETLLDGNIDFTDVVLEKENYTFDGFALSEDLVLGSKTYLAGTNIKTIGLDDSCDIQLTNLSDLSLTPTWKITVGNYSSCNAINLSEAIRLASSNKVDKIEIMGWSNETEQVKINKSVYITTANNSYIYSQALVNPIDSKYCSMIVIEGLGGAKIDVVMENVGFMYSMSNKNYQANVIYATNCNLTLNNVDFNTETNAIVYKGYENTSLTINDSIIECNNSQSVSTLDRDCAILIEAYSSDTSIELNNVNIKCNTDVSGNSIFKGIYYDSIPSQETNLANITLNNVKFVGYQNLDNPTAVAVWLEKDVDLTVTDCRINSADNVCWSTFLLRNYTTTIETGDNWEQILNSNIAYAENISNENFVNCIVVSNRISDSGDNMIFNVFINDNMEYYSEIDFSNIGQMVKYSSFGSNMKYIGLLNTLEIRFELNVVDNQIIDCNGKNLIFLNNVTNNGTIQNTNNITIEDGFVLNNLGTILSSGIWYVDGVLNNGSDTINDCEIEAKTINVSDVGVVSNYGVITNENINNVGIFNNHNSIIMESMGDGEIQSLITNNGELILSQNSVTKCIGNLVNNATISVAGEVTISGTIVNNTSGMLNVASTGIVTLASAKFNNAGIITNEGTLIDNSVGYIEAGSVNNYGINAEISLSQYVEDNQYLVEGKIDKVGSDAIVNDLYPDGTGYYVSFVIYTGINNANKQVTITFNRSDDTEYVGAYQYITKTVTDITDELGRLEIILDVNVIAELQSLYAIDIDIQSESETDNGSGTMIKDVDLDYTLIFATRINKEN